MEILKKVQDIDSSDIAAYVIAMQDIKKELKGIDLKAEHYETRNPAHMNRLLENLSDDQKKRYNTIKWKNGKIQAKQLRKMSLKWSHFNQGIWGYQDNRHQELDPEQARR